MMMMMMMTFVAKNTVKTPQVRTWFGGTIITPENLWTFATRFLPEDHMICVLMETSVPYPGKQVITCVFNPK